MKKFYFYIFIFLIFFAGCNKEQKTPNNGVPGVINLSCNPSVYSTLSGEWEFYWKKLYTPKDFEQHKVTEKPVYVEVPGSWTSGRINGERIPRYGYGTYRIKLILPKSDTTYALKVNLVNTAYNLWIGDSLYIQSKKVAETRKDCIPEISSKAFYFVPEKDTVEIIFNVCNYHHRRSGLTKKIIIGNAQIVAKNNLLQDGLSLFIFGGLLIIGIYHLWLFNYRRKYWEALFFGLATISAAFYSILSGDFLIYKFVPLSWELSYKLNYLANIGRILFFILFLYEAFKNSFNKKIIKWIIIILSAETVLVIFTPARIYSYTIHIIIGVALFFMVYMSYLLIEEIKRRNQVAVISSIGFGLLILAALNDILNQYGIINTMEMTNLGLFLFVSIQSIILSEKYIKTYVIAEQLSQFLKKLDEIKKDLLEIQYKEVKNLLEVIRKHYDTYSISLLIYQDKKFYLYAQQIKDKVKNYIDEKIDLSQVYSDKQKYRIIPELVEFAIDNDEIISINSKSNTYKLLNINKKLDSTSIILVPLKTHEKLLGVLYLEKNSGMFSKSQFESLKLLSVQISAIVNNILTFKQLEQLNKNLLSIVKQRTAEIEAQKNQLEIKTLELDEKIEELSITSEVINSINSELLSQKEILEQKTTLLSRQNKELEEQKNLLDELNKQLTDSINYAQRIQLTLLTAPNNKPECPHFIFFSPKEIVSGDFWWMRNLGSSRIMIIGDTNKHGVTGAFKSLYIITQLNIMLASCKFGKDTSAEEFMSKFYTNIFKSDMDLADVNLSVAIFKDKKVVYTTGENYILLVRGNRIKILSEPEVDREFKQNDVKLQDGDILYFMTDGLFKELEEKYHYLKEDKLNFISKLSNAPIEQQKTVLINNLHSFNTTQADDILILGIRI